MIVTTENQRLYCSIWEYNACRLMTELAKIVENHGGKVKYYKKALISMRGLQQKICDLEQHLDRVNQRIERDPVPDVIKYYNEKKSQLDKLKAINNDPIEVTHTTWIIFVLDGFYYHYEMNDNPFFPFHYLKTHIINGCYPIAYMVEDKKEWEDDCFHRMGCSQADIVEGANLIFNMLCKAKTSLRPSDAKSNRYRKIDF